MFRALLYATAFTGLTAAVAAAPAHAAEAPYPSRPITFIYPFPAGGAGDTLTRALGEEMSKGLGQPVIVDNRAGAAGIIGTSAAAKAPADGYTVLITLTQTIVNNQFLYSKLPYNTTRDLAFVTELCTANVLLTVNPSVPATNVKELLAWAKEANHANFGSWGVGSYGHLVSAYLAQTRHVQFTHVAYKGEAPMVQDLVGGNINVAMTSLSTTKPFADAGKLRVLAVTSDQRLPQLPDVPTLKEAGLGDPEFKPTGSIVMMVPNGTPAPVIARLEKEALRAMDTTGIKARLQVMGLASAAAGAKVARANYDALMPVQERLVKISGVRLD